MPDGYRKQDIFDDVSYVREMIIIFDHLIVDMIDQDVEEERKGQIHQHTRHQPEIWILIQILLIYFFEAEVEEVDYINRY